MGISKTAFLFPVNTCTVLLNDVAVALSDRPAKTLVFGSVSVCDSCQFSGWMASRGISEDFK